VSRWRWGEALAPLRAVRERGGILAIPSESSYGLGVDPMDAAAVERIFRIKGREPRKPLPVVVADAAQLRRLGIDPESPEVAPFLAIWPAALNVLAPLGRPVAAAAGEARLAVRVPGHAGLRALLAELGPLTATSANRSGEPPLVDPGAAETLLAGEDALVVDDGVLPGGPPSTLVELDGGELRVLRAGRFPVERLPSAGAAAGRAAKPETEPRV
jgi:L-threonylcarbamoyladenylate synthase